MPSAVNLGDYRIECGLWFGKFRVRDPNGKRWPEKFDTRSDAIAAIMKAGKDER